MAAHDCTYDIFVSYAPSDASLAWDMVAWLENAGVKCWFAPRDARPDRSIDAEILQGLKTSRGLLLVRTRNVNTTGIVRNELVIDTDHRIYWFCSDRPDTGELIECYQSELLGANRTTGGAQVYWEQIAFAVERVAALPKRNSKPQFLANVLIWWQRWRIGVYKSLSYFVIGWFFLIVDPLGLGAALDRGSERVFYNVIAPIYGTSDVNWNRHITVLLLDDEALKLANNGKGENWPVSLSFHAKVLGKLYRDYAPTVIMIDLLFLGLRESDLVKSKNGKSGLDRFHELLVRIEEEGRTKVFLASDTTDPRFREHVNYRGQEHDWNDRYDQNTAHVHGVLPELSSAAELTTVSWSAPDNYGDAPLYYPVASLANTRTSRDPGAAFSIYRYLCITQENAIREAMSCQVDPISSDPEITNSISNLDEAAETESAFLCAFRRPPCNQDVFDPNLSTPEALAFWRSFEKPMQVVWGVKPPPLNLDQVNLGVNFDCRPVSGLISRFFNYALEGFLRSIAEFLNIKFNMYSEFPQQCPYTQMIQVRDFMDEEFTSHEDVEIAYKKAMKYTIGENYPKVVFYGAELIGIEDKIYAPTHGKVPGVYFHAMALDNMMSMGDNYIKYEEPWISKYILDPMLILCAISLTILVRVSKYKIYSLNNGNRFWRAVDIGVGPVTIKGIAYFLTSTIIVFAFFCFAAYLGYSILNISPVNWIGFWGLFEFVRNFDYKVEILYPK